MANSTSLKWQSLKHSCPCLDRPTGNHKSIRYQARLWGAQCASPGASHQLRKQFAPDRESHRGINYNHVFFVFFVYISCFCLKTRRFVGNCLTKKARSPRCKACARALSTWDTLSRIESDSLRSAKPARRWLSPAKGLPHKKARQLFLACEAATQHQENKAQHQATFRLGWKRPRSDLDRNDQLDGTTRTRTCKFCKQRIPQITAPPCIQMIFSSSRILWLVVGWYECRKELFWPLGQLKEHRVTVLRRKCAPDNKPGTEGWQLSFPPGMLLIANKARQ